MVWVYSALPWRNFVDDGEDATAVTMAVVLMMQLLLF
jgi:hypothetical protein